MIGPLIGAHDVRGAVQSTLQAWLPSVLAEITAVRGTPLPAPTSYAMPDADAIRKGSAEIPAVVVSSTGLTGTPSRDGDGEYGATWRAIVTVYARGAEDSYESTAAAVDGYTVAVRTALLQHPSLGGFASELVWVGEEYAAIDSSAWRTLGGAFISFDVTVDDVTDVTAGPVTPPVGVSPPPVDVTTVDVTIGPLETETA